MVLSLVYLFSYPMFFSHNLHLRQIGFMLHIALYLLIVFLNDLELSPRHCVYAQYISVYLVGQYHHGLSNSWYQKIPQSHRYLSIPLFLTKMKHFGDFSNW